jgi:site-specific DNA recombinase
MNGVNIISVTENLDDSPEIIMLESVIEGMAQYYSSNLAREVRKGQKETALQHKHLGGTPPLGLDVDPQTRQYVINEKEAEIVMIIFEKYAEGTGSNQILTYLNSRGYRTKRSNQFGKNSLYSILENEKYVGNYVFNKRLEKNVVGKRNPTVRPRKYWIIAEDVIPAIIDQRTFYIVQAKISENKRKAGQYTVKEIYLLSGLIFCGECGRSMCGNVRTNGRRSGNYASYRCSGRHNKHGCHNKEIRRDYIDNYVLDELYNRLFSKVSITNLAEMLNDYNAMMSSQSDSEITTIKTQIQDIDRI